MTFRDIHEPCGYAYGSPGCRQQCGEPAHPVDPAESRGYAATLEHEVNELRGIVAAMMVKYASGRCVLNPDVLGSVEPSLLRIDTSLPGMVVIRYGS